MTPTVGKAMNDLRAFLYANVYSNSAAKAEDAKAQELLCRLFEYYKERPEKMPALYFGNIGRDGVERCVCDFISGMTDRYAVELYNSLFVPQVWGHNA